MDLEKLKALARAATPGPWQWWTSNSVVRLTGADGRDGGVISSYMRGSRLHGSYSDILCSKKDAAFIAAFNPAVALELIAEIKRLKIALENERIESRTLRHGLRRADADKGKDW